ncbi:MAG: hypothetical protein OXG56_08000 [Gammaproteobacteria bacterium]|nr:hypothetical protein [Gammaproteobacteria bacterium]
MHESTGFSIREFSAVIFEVVRISKRVSRKTGTRDVLWLTVAGAMLTDIGLLPTHSEFLEPIGG